MKHLRYGIFALVAALLLGAYAASAALAAPEFQREEAGKSVVGVKEKTSSGTATLSTTEPFTKEVIVVTCTAETGSAVIKSTTEVEKVAVTYTGCTAKKGTKSCGEAYSPGNKGKKEITTEPLKGVLGEVATSEATTGVGLKLEPETAKNFVVVETEKTCPASTEVKGSVIGEVSPVNEFNTEGKLIFAENTSKQQKIRHFVGEAGSDVLKAFGFAESVQVQTETVKFEEGGTPVKMKVT